MKKFVLYTLWITILFASLVPPVFAENKVQNGKIYTPDGRGVHLRSGPGTSYNREGGYDDGRIVTILDTVATNDGTTGCASGKWYKIKYINALGHAYVCTSFVELIDLIENPNYKYEEELAKFPSSYQTAIQNLHEIYPNAIFTAVYATNSKAAGGTRMDFSTALYNESVSLGKSLLWDSNGSRDGLKHLSSYNYNNNAFANNYSGGGANWYAANEEIIAYYLDSRNFLNEKNIFMYENLSYIENFHTLTGIESILSGSYMSNAYVDGGSTKETFAEVIMQAGMESGVSPYFLASRIIQEVGYQRSSLVKGIYPDYPQFNGYYNYYNIGATGEIDKIVYNGLTRAVQEGWNSEKNAIIGGAKKIGNDYISAGQDTQYFQKWDIQCSGKNSCFSHQYMQNIEAPYNEGNKTYNAYKKSMSNNMYLLPYLFKIPVYENMPEQLSAKPSEASPIPYLSRLVVNGSSVTNFSGLITEYTINVPANTTSISIEASSIASNKGGKVAGTGNIAITNDKQDVIVTGIAANGNKLNYTIHVNRLKPGESNMTLEDTLNKLDELIIDDEYFVGLTYVEAIHKVIAEANPNALVVIKNTEGKVITSGNIGTGYTFSITVGSDSVEVVLVIYGDNDGDGEITILDLLRIQKQLLKATNLNEAQYEACDVNHDKVVDILDLLLVQKHLLGEKYINQ